MNEDGFAALAARSAQVRTEHRMLLDGLQAFEQRLQDLVGGLNARGCSKDVLLDQITDSDDASIGHTVGYLHFNGKRLYVAARDEPLLLGMMTTDPIPSPERSKLESR